nr:unnamed protein product [Callosobruchus chinensis]
MDTPITISSTTSTEKKSPNDSVFSLDCISEDRVQVSWDKGAVITSTPFTNVGKVKRWMGDIEAINHLDDESDIDNISLSSSCVDTPSTVKTDTNSLILMRCDYNKTFPQSQKKCLKTIKSFDHSKYLQYLREKSNTPKNLSKTTKSPSKSTKSSSKSQISGAKNVVMKRSVLLKQSPEKSNFCGYSSPVDKKFSIDRDSYPTTKQLGDGMMEEGTTELAEVPMSPESRKKVLCSYLQLMDPADKKEILILQNRRSTRVRNLAAMQEKKQLEKQIMSSKEAAAPKLPVPPKEIKIIREFSLSNVLIKQPKPRDFKVNSSKDHEPKIVAPLEIQRPPKEGKVTHIVSPSAAKDMSTEEKIPEEKCELLKSFKELNIELEQFMEKVLPPEERCTFCFPFPPKEMTEEIVDFDVLMTALVPKYRKTCRLRGLKLQSSENATAKKNKTKDPKQKISNTKQENNNKIDYIPDSINQLKAKQSQIVPKIRLRPNILRKKNPDRVKNLRSKKDLSNVPFKKLVSNDRQVKAWKIMKKRAMSDSSSPTINNGGRKMVVDKQQKEESRHVDIATVKPSVSDRNVELEDIIDDIVHLNNLTEEHKRCLIESRIFSTEACRLSKPEMERSGHMNYSLDGLSAFSGFSRTDAQDAEKISEVCQITALKEKRKSVDAQRAPQEFVANGLTVRLDRTESNIEPDGDASMQEHDYAELPDSKSVHDEEEVDVETVPSINLPVDPLRVDTRSILPEPKNGETYEIVPFTRPSGSKSLLKSLQLYKRKSDSGSIEQNGTQDWDSDSGSVKLKATKKQSHSINIAKENGHILKAFYVDYNLVICQESCVSFWMQSSLGHVLGSQNMWIPRGRAQRITLNQHMCIQKESMEMVVSTETTVAYVELWTKEHQSEIRQGPVADVFATVYFWKQRQKGVEKKVLQLENINGWHCASDDNLPKMTIIHCYHMAADYQTVSNIQIIEPVQHYVSSLHNIEDCENLIMGCGENKITLWNVEHGYKIATIELSEIKTPLSTLWVKCDRVIISFAIKDSSFIIPTHLQGFLFALQQCVDRELRLVAINGMNDSWKKLASYSPPDGFDRLKGVCVENGMLLSFYDKGVVCWNAETGEPVEEIPLETELIPCGKYVIFLEDTRVIVKHVMTHLMSISADDT